MSGPGLLTSAVAKFERARDQYVLLHDQVHGRRGKYSPHPVRRKSNADGTEHRFYLGTIDQPDPAWSLLFGELMFNLRCALDHLVYALHVRALGKEPPRRVAKGIAFPIFGSHPTYRNTSIPFPSSKWKEVAHLPTADRALVKLLQPYVRRDDELRWTRMALARLNRLQNRDKHRVLHVVRSAFDMIGVPSIPPEYGFRHEFVFGPVESGTEVDVWHFSTPPPNVPMHMGVFVQVAIEERPGEFTPIVTLAESFRNEVGNVIGLFSDRFPGEWPYPVA